MTPARTEIPGPDNLWARKPAVEPTEEPELVDVALWAIARLLGGNPAAAEEQFLSRRCAGLSDDATEVRGRLEVLLGRPAPGDRPLVSLAGQLQLSPLETLAAALCVAVEEDPSVGRAIAYAQAPVAGSRPCLGLLDAAFGVLGEEGRALGSGAVTRELASGNAVQSGVLRLEGDGVPLPEQVLRVPLGLALALRGGAPRWPGARSEPSGGPLELPPSLRRRVEARARVLGDGEGQTLVIRSASRREAESAAGAVAVAVGREALFVDLLLDGAGDRQADRIGLGALCVVSGRVPVFVFDGVPGERKLLPDLHGYRGPVLAATGQEGAVEAPAGTQAEWTLGVPSENERRQQWNRLLGSPRLAREVAREHVHGTARIDQLGHAAVQEAALRGARRVGREDLRKAAWSGEGGGLASLAQPVPASVPDEALVLPNHTRRELDLLLQRCKVRETLGDDLGVTVRTSYRMGVKALFVGPSGTGKTLAGSWLATRLLLPLYRVDLAAVTSKYIGETEKNLAVLLARAEQSEVVLLFDEADSLFGKRTEVREANDRFANAQTNYLLQRIETYRGIVLLTSNSRARFDSSFSRRIDMVVEFPLPGPEERRDLWQTHLGKRHDLTPAQINRLAAGADVAGGHIRNAVLTAAAVARAADGPVTYGGVLRGLAVEYRKLGRKLPTELSVVGEEETP